MNNSTETILRASSLRLQEAGIESPDRDARLLLRHVLGVDGAGLAVMLSNPLSPTIAEAFETAINRRIEREPLSHITGQREFWGRTFEVNREVLDPRPETECLIAEALHRGPFSRLLDLGTGSGCILLSLLSELGSATGVGADVSAAALEVAARNADRLGVAHQCELVTSNWYSDVSGVFDLIVSNPPYIAENEMPDLSPEVRDFEPELALTPGADGLAAYVAIANDARQHLSPNGMLMVEIGPTQSHQVCAIFANAGLLVQAVIPDLDQRPRAIIAHL